MLTENINFEIDLLDILVLWAWNVVFVCNTESICLCVSTSEAQPPLLHITTLTTDCSWVLQSQHVRSHQHHWQHTPIHCRNVERWHNKHTHTRLFVGKNDRKNSYYNSWIKSSAAKYTHTSIKAIIRMTLFPQTAARRRLQTVSRKLFLHP